jgi:uncharacterized protein with HEPN domain
MDRRLRLRLNHIVDAIDQIDLILQKGNFTESHSDRVRWAAYERFLEIVSEASRHVTADLKALAPQISWRNIADIGNHLRHGYDRLDPTILWEIHATGQLADLRVVAAGLLERLD